MVCTGRFVGRLFGEEGCCWFGGGATCAAVACLNHGITSFIIIVRLAGGSLLSLHEMAPASTVQRCMYVFAGYMKEGRNVGDDIEMQRKRN